MNSKCILTAAILAAILPAGLLAQSYPTKPVRIIVPLVPGGNLDIVARAVGQRLGEGLGQQVIVENRPGASSLVGTQYVAKSAADGYTLLAMANTFASVPSVVANPGYDPVKDFTGVTLTCKVAQVLVVTPALPVKSVKELVALAKARPGDLNYASGAPGATSQLAAELFKSMAGVKIVWVPYKDNGPGVLSVLAGQTQIMFANAPGVEELAKAGKVRILGVTTARASPVFPGVPSIAEAGVPGYEALTIDAIVVPARTPAAIVNRLNQEIVRALNEPGTKKTLFNSGVVVVGGTPEELGAFIKSSIAKWSKVIKEAGAEVN